MTGVVALLLYLLVVTFGLSFAVGWFSELLCLRFCILLLCVVLFEGWLSVFVWLLVRLFICLMVVLDIYEILFYAAFRFWLVLVYCWLLFSLWYDVGLRCVGLLRCVWVSA